MDKLPAFGKEIYATIQPTTKAFIPLLQKNAEAIKSVPCTTHVYGPLNRHKLDLYMPSSQFKNPPFLFFLCGGGLVTGARRHPLAPDLVFANLGAFYAKRGFITAVADYRLVPIAGAKGEGGETDLSGGKEAGKYPSGSEDVEYVLRWAKESLPSIRADADTSRLYAIGNSAGGLHAMSYLLDPDFQLSPNKPKLSKIVTLGAPLDFVDMDPSRGEVITAYFGRDAQGHLNPTTPDGLLNALTPEQVAQLPPILVLESPLDPDEITKPGARFAKAYKAKGGKGLFEVTEDRHNHISTAWALSSGEGEKYGERVVKFLNEP